MKILLAGGTGFVGKGLLEKLQSENNSIYVISRNPDAHKHLENKNIEIIPWDDSLISKMEVADAVINLTGEPVVGKRWTSSQKDLLASSRIDSTRVLVNAISKANKKPQVLINASAVGYYGSPENGKITESYKKGTGFLSDICEQWEKEAQKAKDFGVRVVTLRIGIVLEKNGGALSRMLLPFKLYTGGPLGSGKQWFPWIHRDDAVNAILFSLNNSNIQGPINLTSPEPVSMGEFCNVLGKVMHRPSWAPVPEFALKALLGEMSSVLLTGQRAIPKKLTDEGYKFSYPKLEDALKAILK